VITQATGTINDGKVDLDQRIELPDNSRVRVAIEPLENWRTKFTAGLKQWMALCEQKPIRSGGRRFTRDELHERR
jgi:hypothetical protein